MRVALPSLCLAFLACGPTELEPAARTDAILAATNDTTSLNVFALDVRFDNGNGICTAVLISPRVLLTAAHCVDPAYRGATTVTVRAMNEPDSTMLTSTDLIDVSTIAYEPNWDPGAGNSPNDSATLLLARAPGVAFAPLQRTIPSGLVGQSIRIVGYGRTAASVSDSGTRRTATVPVTGLTTNYLEFGSDGATGICAGDSGGPAFYRGSDSIERVIGTHSYGRSGNCGAGSDVRVDRHLPFIDGFIAANDPALCTMDSRCATGCATPDPDCPTNCGADGVCATGCASPDPDCACRADGACETTCPSGVTDPDCVCRQNGTCETTCPSGVTDPDCQCRADAVCEATCASGVTDPDCASCGADGTCSMASCPGGDADCLGDGDVCSTAETCPGRVCLADPRGFSYCSRACTASSECQRDMVCQAQRCRPPGGTDAEEPVSGGCSAPPGGAGVLVAVMWLARRRA